MISVAALSAEDGPADTETPESTSAVVAPQKAPSPTYVGWRSAVKPLCELSLPAGQVFVASTY